MCLRLHNSLDPSPLGMASCYRRDTVLLSSHGNSPSVSFVAALKARFVEGCLMTHGSQKTLFGRTCWTLQILAALTLCSLSRLALSLVLRRARHCSHSGRCLRLRLHSLWLLDILINSAHGNVRISLVVQPPRGAFIDRSLVLSHRRTAKRP